MQAYTSVVYIGILMLTPIVSAEAQTGTPSDAELRLPHNASGFGEVISGETPPTPIGDTETLHALETDLSLADKCLKEGKPEKALVKYMTVLDTATAIRSEVALEAGARVDDFLRAVPDMPQEHLDTIEASLPAWESLQTDQGRGALMRFIDTRRKRYVLEGDAANATSTAQMSRDMSWNLIESNSSASVIRAAVKIYRYATETLGEAEKGSQDLLAQSAKLPPSPAKFCIEYWAAQDAAKAGDAAALAQHCRTLLDIYEKGALAPALNDPFGGASDKLLMEYHVAYAQFVLGRLDEALQQCDRILEVYAHVIDHRREEHGCLAMTALLRAMTLAAQAQEPATALEAYNTFLTRYPGRPQAAMAWLQKGIVYAKQGNTGQATACFDECVARATHPDAADAAREARARRVELTAKPAS